MTESVLSNSPAKLALGCEQLGGYDWGTIDKRELERVVLEAWDLGVRYFDTANVYGLGESERVLSRILDWRRSDAQIITKFGLSWQTAPGARASIFNDASPSGIETALTESLRRLRLDAIPIYLLHWPDPMIDLDSVFDTLDRIRKRGDLVQYGVCNVKWNDIKDKVHERHQPFYYQRKLNPIDTEAVEDLKGAGGANIINLTYAPLKYGFLTGKYSEYTTFLNTDRRHRLDDFSVNSWSLNQNKLERLRRIAAEMGCTLSQVSLAWSFSRDYVGKVICGAKTLTQLRENWTALGLAKKLNFEELDR